VIRRPLPKPHPLLAHSKGKSITYVSGTKCYLCVGPLTLPKSSGVLPTRHSSRSLLAFNHWNSFFEADERSPASMRDDQARRGPIASHRQSRLLNLRTLLRNRELPL